MEHKGTSYGLTAISFLEPNQSTNVGCLLQTPPLITAASLWLCDSLQHEASKRFWSANYVNYYTHSTVQQILTTVVLVYLGVANRLQLIPYLFIQGILRY